MREQLSNNKHILTNWAIWPRYDKSTTETLQLVLQSGRWAISGESTGQPSYNELVSKALAKYHDVSYCITCANGSSALVIALEAVGVRYGDEVLVPALNWVACATAVLRVGATPVFVDIDEDSLCMSPDEAKKLISRKTRAILCNVTCIFHYIVCLYTVDGQ